MKKKIKKILFALFISLGVFSLDITPTRADWQSLANPVEAMNAILDDLGVNKNELKYSIQTMNVARQKKNPPMVSLSFDPTDPVPGEKVTVIATPTNFLNNTEDLYFTWYLKNKRCYDRETDGVGYKNKFASGDFEKCDLNDTGEVDIEDYKIKAMRILANYDYPWDQSSYTADTDNDGYTAYFGGDDQKGKLEHCYIHNVETGDEYELETCAHLFPNAPGDETGDNKFGLTEEEFWRTNPYAKDTSNTGNTDEANVAGLGENVFTFTYTAGDKIGVAIEGISTEPTQYEDASYKTMWALTKNTCDVSTDQNAYPKTTTTVQQNTPSIGYTTTTITTEDIVDGTQINDSATIRTLTRIVVTFAGVVISDETTSTCPPETSTIIIDDTTYDCSGTDATDQSILTTDMTVDNLNDCLYKNLVTPAEGGGATEKLDVSLSYSPENPINDAGENKNGDELSFKSSVINASNSAYLNYTWEVFANDEPNPDSWGSALSKSALDDATQTSGLGINSFKFKLNFEESKKYLKIKLTVNDTLTEGGEREGHTDVVVPIFSSEKRIKVYTAKVSLDTDGKNPTVSLPDNSQERCLLDDETTPAALCEIAQNEIIAVKIDNADSAYTDFLWTLDGENLTCPDINFQGCISNDKQTNISYFPVLKISEDQYSVNLSALNTGTGERLDLTRVFKVSAPAVKIIPNEKTNPADSSQYTCRGLLLGDYIDIYGKSFEDRSNTKFQALTGYNLELYPVFSGIDTPETFAKPEDCPYKWNVDGNIITTANVTDYGYSIDLNDYGKLILPPKNYGESYKISFSNLFTQNNAVKQVLNKYWNVSYNGFYEKKLTDSIEVAMVSAEIAQKENSPQKIFATVSSGIPNYIAFLFRIILSGVVIIFSVKIIFFILPRSNSNEF
ncbi:MAG TPA: hypothetical protein DCS28_03765 [Candidatus Moranbacteria bacterium]|nr:hypothetical protein [Candidatus Moranbacteria bacterium]HAT75128.1 hypothetical protein [Candidatus Moranbacteria bacterium]